MTALSTEDKLRLKVSAKRVEAWNRYKLLPPKKVKRCTLTIFSPNQDKPVERLDLDKMPVVERLTDGSKYREVNIVPLRNGDNFHDYGHDAPRAAPIGASDKAKRNGTAIVYKQHAGLATSTPRPDSPYKRRDSASKPVVIVRGKL